MVTAESNGQTIEIVSDIVLMSVGRKPNTDGLNLESAGVKKDSKGRISTDKNSKQI